MTAKFTKTCYNYYDSSGTKSDTSTCLNGATYNGDLVPTYSPFRYDLNNFFFVNGDSKSYSASATKDDIVKNKYIGTLQSGGNDWICFCGDGQLDLTVAPTGVTSGTITYQNASNATVSVPVTDLSSQTITIDPSTHLYVPQGDGTYKISLTLTNVQVSSAAMSDTTKVIRHTHPNITPDALKNVRIVDFNTNKPTNYGSIIFGEDANGGLSSHGHSYDLIDHLKYWTSSNGYNHFYHKNISGDLFCILWDYLDTSLSVSWYQSTDYGGFGNYPGAYPDSYSFSGLHRSFFPWGTFENHSDGCAHFNIGGKAALVFGGFTLPLNYALCNNGYQTPAGTNQVSPSAIPDPDVAVASVTGDSCAKLKSLANTRVYVIKYRTTDLNSGNSKTALDKCAYGTSSPYTQTVSNEEDLKSALQKIADDIKIFAGHKDQYVKEINP
jgi:hypothetical protein